MFPLFETIRLVDGRPLHLDWHNARMNRSRRELFGTGPELDLADALRPVVAARTGVFRCRIPYGETLGAPAIVPYEPRPVQSLVMVAADGVEYPHKFADRSAIDDLAVRAAGAGAGDILMVRAGLVTDTSTANVAFFDGRSWITPADPLLPGTARARLLYEGRITAGRISPDDLRPDPEGANRGKRYRSVALFSALVDFDPAAAISVERIGRL